MEETKKAPLFINGFVLKIIAFVFMTIDHLGYAFQIGAVSSSWPVNDVFRTLGRLAFPLFMFLLAEGMMKSHRRGKYLKRIALMYALITIGESIMIMIPFVRENGFTEFSLDPHPFADILFNGAMLFFLYQKGWKKSLALIPFGIIVFSFVLEIVEAKTGTYQAYFPYYLRSGYNLIGPAFSLGFTLGMHGFSKFAERTGIEKESMQHQLLTNVSGILISAALYITLAAVCSFTMPTSSAGGRLYAWQSFCLFSLVFVLFYNGKRGYDRPWWRIFSYWYFLLHMGIIAIIVLFFL